MNSNIACILSQLGHTDSITIADAGLPIPSCVTRIDLALKKGMPSFLDTLQVIVEDMVIEKVVLAPEIREHNIDIYQGIQKIIRQEIRAFDIPIAFAENHAHFKQLTEHTKAIIRTGEATPYANIILQSGVFFTFK